jgi:putative flippase GtrA
MKKPASAVSRVRVAGAALADGREQHRFIRFLIVGLSNTVVSFISYSIALAILPSAPGMASLAQIASYGAGMFWSYAWNRRWVFASGGPLRAQSARFFGVQIGLMLFSALLIGSAVDQHGANPVWAWLVTMTIVTIVNFLLLRLWIFRT